MIVDTTDKFVSFLENLFKEKTHFYDTAVFEIEVRENQDYKTRKYKTKRYICTFRHGPFNENPIKFEYNTYCYIDEKQLETLVLGAISKNSAYYINWKKKKIEKSSEVMG